MKGYFVLSKELEDMYDEPKEGRTWVFLTTGNHRNPINALRADSVNSAGGQDKERTVTDIVYYTSMRAAVGAIVLDGGRLFEVEGREWRRVSATEYLAADITFGKEIDVPTIVVNFQRVYSGRSEWDLTVDALRESLKNTSFRNACVCLGGFNVLSFTADDAADRRAPDNSMENEIVSTEIVIGFSYVGGGGSVCPPENI
jgi:hypothetical protein